MPKIVGVLVLLIVVLLGGYFFFGGSSDVDSMTVELALDDANQALANHDASAILTAAKRGLDADPENYALTILHARALCLQTRYREALAAAEVARDLADDAAQTEEANFWIVRAYAGRYVDAGDRADLNHSESELRSLVDHPTYGGAAKVLLGTALIRKGEPEAGKPLLEAGLADPTAKVLLGDLTKAEKALKQP